jgi:hypothetical protein
MPRETKASPYELAAIYVALGNNEEAFQSPEKHTRSTRSILLI